MSATAAAMDFGTAHEPGIVFLCTDGIVQCLIETGPAGTAVEFGGGVIDRQATAGAME